MRLLLVEDNLELAASLRANLEAAGYPADHVETAADACATVKMIQYGAVVLDLGLPDGEGLDVLKEIRRQANPVPVLVLTARSGVADRVNGLRSGADDYLVKPFAFDELIARLEALSRRPSQFSGRTLHLANIALDLQSRQFFVDGKPQTLSAREATVLELLLSRRGQVIQKKLVEDQIFGIAGDVSSNAIEVYVHRLRRQLADYGAKVQIHTVRGVGYLLLEEA
ncbi:MAG TPA: response regulator transcription factor [Xanthobacteraceae bacterium]|nr:response regulator transcription factor [Xanthobacteraceae bacterium]